MDFSIGTKLSTNILTQWTENVPEEPFPESLKSYWTLGALSVVGAFKWLCIEAKTGRIVTVDWENEIVVSTVNKSPLMLTRCMLTLLKWSNQFRGKKNDCRQLKDQLTRIDDESGMWIHFVEWLLQDNEYVQVGVERFKGKSIKRSGTKVTKKVKPSKRRRGS